jgi:hypothetical protein
MDKYLLRLLREESKKRAEKQRPKFGVDPRKHNGLVGFSRPARARNSESTSGHGGLPMMCLMFFV